MDSLPLAIMLGLLGIGVGLFVWQQVVHWALFASGLLDGLARKDVSAIPKVVRLAKQLGAAWVITFGGAAAYLYLAAIPHGGFAGLLAGAAIVPILVLPRVIRIARGERAAKSGRIRRLITKASRTLMGTMALMQVIWTPVMSALGMYLSYEDGALTVTEAFRIVAIVSIGGAFATIPLYMLVSGMRPVSRDGRLKDSDSDS
ncbi:MAG TPA: hypothetical protein PLR35_18555 [Burkholderiaceae bacterium]|nr:hypothetical protein [Steroidobacteraceae bacterium]HQR78424.1 hypothetical protein [Burkholderiaceae bacterium]